MPAAASAALDIPLVGASISLASIREGVDFGA